MSSPLETLRAGLLLGCIREHKFGYVLARNVCLRDARLRQIMPAGITLMRCVPLSLRLRDLRFLARNAVPGISHLNFGPACRLHRPTLEPITPLSRPLPHRTFAYSGTADSQAPVGYPHPEPYFAPESVVPLDEGQEKHSHEQPIPIREVYLLELHL